MEMNWAEVKELLDRSLIDLTALDGKLLYLDANERSITHRLAYHLEKHLRKRDNVKNLSVDCEYNRETDEQGKAKRIPLIERKLRKESQESPFRDTSGRTVFPDIIVHERGKSNNLLVIEAKKLKEPSESDKLKLGAFTDPSGSFRYQFGVFVGLLFEEDRKITTASVLRFVGDLTTEDSFTAEYKTKFQFLDTSPD